MSATRLSLPLRLARGLRRPPTLLLLVPLLATAACEEADDPVDPVERPVVIGAALSLTGDLSVEGNDAYRGYEIWVNWLNEERGGLLLDGERRQVAVIVYDDESDPERSALLVERLIVQDRVDFLLGPYGSSATMTTSAVANEHGVIMVEGNGSADGLYERGFERFFGVLTPGSQYSHSALDALAAAGARTIAVAYEEDAAFSAAVGKGAVEHAAELGLEVVAEVVVDPVTDQPSDVIGSIAALDPDVFVGGSYFQDAVLIRRTADQLGFRPPAMLLTVGPTNPKFIEELGAAADGVLGPTQWEPSMTWQGEYFGTPAAYAARYIAAYGSAPTYQAAQSTAAGLVLQAAIEAAGSLDAAEVTAALRALDIMTFYGPIDFDAQGRNAAKPMGVVQIQDGEIVVVAPADVAVEPLIYPANEE